MAADAPNKGATGATGATGLAKLAHGSMFFSVAAGGSGGTLSLTYTGPGAPDGARDELRRVLDALASGLPALAEAQIQADIRVDAAAQQRSTTTAYNCGSPSIWVQVLARAYGRGFNSQCEVDPYGGAVSYAAYGAQTDDVIAQIAAHRGELNSSTLVTIMVGQNDILEQYQLIQGSSQTEAGAIGVLQSRAADMAARIHAQQRRKGAAREPYVNHLLEVAYLVAEATRGADPEAVVAALLHDAIEVLSNRKISELPVVDDSGQPIGLIDITDVIGLMPEERPD